MTVKTLTADELVFGSAIDNTQTDIYQVTGGNDYILERQGNLTVDGGTYPLGGGGPRTRPQLS